MKKLRSGPGKQDDNAAADQSNTYMLPGQATQKGNILDELKIILQIFKSTRRMQ